MAGSTAPAANLHNSMQKRHALKLPFAGVFPIKMKQLQIVVHKIQTEAHCPLNLQRLFAAVLDNRSSRYDILFLKNSVIQVYINFLE